MLARKSEKVIHPNGIRNERPAIPLGRRNTTSLAIRSR
jgi:hypothetical protein